jgi:hypothetical protein
MKMRFLLLWLGVAVASAILIAQADAQQRSGRVALLIGNAAYPDASTPLSTTVRDTRSLAEELRRNDFEADVKENLGKEDRDRQFHLNGVTRTQQP